jgi:hypothetical protein
MIVDRYTTTVLSIIAFALLWNAFANSIGTARAAKDITRVAICDPKDPGKCAEVITWAGATKLFVTQ